MFMAYCIWRRMWCWLRTTRQRLLMLVCPRFSVTTWNQISKKCQQSLTSPGNILPQKFWQKVSPHFVTACPWDKSKYWLSVKMGHTNFARLVSFWTRWSQIEGWMDAYRLMLVLISLLIIVPIWLHASSFLLCLHVGHYNVKLRESSVLASLFSYIDILVNR